VKDGQSVEKVKLSVNGIHIMELLFRIKIAYEFRARSIMVEIDEQTGFQEK
jgi:hypothetical protein